MAVHASLAITTTLTAVRKVVRCCWYHTSTFVLFLISSTDWINCEIVQKREGLVNVVDEILQLVA